MVYRGEEVAVQTWYTGLWDTAVQTWYTVDQLFEFPARNLTRLDMSTTGFHHTSNAWVGFEREIILPPLPGSPSRYVSSDLWSETGFTVNVFFRLSRSRFPFFVVRLTRGSLVGVTGDKLRHFSAGLLHPPHPDSVPDVPYAHTQPPPPIHARFCRSALLFSPTCFWHSRRRLPLFPLSWPVSAKWRCEVYIYRFSVNI